MKKTLFSFAALFFALAVVCVSSCDTSQRIPANFDYGTWAGATYRNDFFGFKIALPEDWHVADKGEMQAAMKDAQSLEFADEKEMKRIAKVASITTANLFMASRYTDEEAMAEEVFNPNIALVAENLSIPGKTITRSEYIKLSRENIVKAMPGATIKGESTRMIAGREFSSLKLEIDYQGIPIRQEHLVCLEKNFALTFALTYIDESDKDELDDIMATLQWD